MTISNVSNLTFTGNGAIINCDGKSMGFIFNHSANITLKNMEFVSCTRQHFHDAPATLTFVDGFGLILSTVKMWGSVYEAIFIKNTLGVVDLRKLTVANSNTGGQQLQHAGCTIIYNQCFNQTPHLMIKDSNFINNTKLARSRNDNSIPGRNHSIPFAGGLTIHLECLSIDIEMINLTMKGNSGGDGGNLAILFGISTCGNVKIIGSHFESGYSLGGSGLYTEFNMRGLLNENTICLPCQEPYGCLLYTSPSPRDATLSRMPSSA